MVNVLPFMCLIHIDPSGVIFAMPDSSRLYIVASVQLTEFSIFHLSFVFLPSSQLFLSLTITNIVFLHASYPLMINSICSTIGFECDNVIRAMIEKS